MSHDVLFISRADWANVGSMCAKACRAVGYKAVSAVLRRHEFEYPTDNVIWRSMPELQRMADSAAAVVFMHSQFIAKLKLNMNTQRVAVFHGGSAYRDNPRGYAEGLKNRVHKSFIQSADLMGFGSREETWLIPPVDDEFIQPQMRTIERMGDGYILGHYPRSTGDGLSRKGAANVCSTMRQFKGRCKFWFSAVTRPWKEHLARVAACDIYIERLGDRCLEWGVSALEAAALGKVVITTFAGKSAYEEVFGECPLIVANTKAELAEKVESLLSMAPSEIREIQVRTREWVKKTHGLKATGSYIVRELRISSASHTTSTETFC